MPHIVDTLIEERAGRLMRNRLVWRFVQSSLYPLLGYQQAVDLVETVKSMSALEIFHHLTAMLEMQVEVEGLANLPAAGAAILMPNHPAGIADGVAVFDAIRSVREDITFFANRDAIRAAPELEQMIVPVEWVNERRTRQRSRETVKGMARAFREERLIVIFPSGRLAQPTLKGLIERPWQATAINLANRYDCPVIPMHISGRNSWVYYLFYLLHDELRDMTLFRELLNKKQQRYQLTLAHPFSTRAAMAAENLDAETLTRRLRDFVAEGIPKGERRFGPGIDPEQVQNSCS
ncbi:MAG: 1-acyl-sn-glycerol-3-phosphate acyltransferase [Pseudomonadales bacterium]|nr:1-acyl-sn-glycerol-3-phosphate acyltransferase [Pseudomonadales bacterium]